MFTLKHKTAVITGGASGIGKAIALLFAERGAFVHLLELNEAEARNTVKEIKDKGGKIKFHQCDVSKHDQVREVFSQIAKKFSIDILINNAGIAQIGNIEKTTEDDLDRVYNVNVKGVFNCTQAVIPLMKEKGGGNYKYGQYCCGSGNFR